MQLHSILINKACPAKPQRSRGFTLIEIAIVIGIISFLAAFGVIVGLDSYSRYVFHSDADTAVAMLQKARSEAINNIGESPHGVYFGNAANLILFSGASFAARNPAYDLKLAKSKTGSFGGAAEVVFSQLSGITTDANITISDGIRNVTITINNEGGIDW